ncbi:MAG: hypothetical protein JWQ96_2707, partial [Segetibacter sp.]|nr:hypothetical protein [Segetibacter sp.]
MRTSEGIDWDTLCTNIRNKNVIPIIGNEMYSCIVNGQTSNAEKWFAEKLFEEFAPGGTAPATLT